MKLWKLKETFPTGASVCADFVQTLCVYKGSFGTNCVTTLQLMYYYYETVLQEVVAAIRVARKRQVTKEVRLVGQRFILQWDNDPEHPSRLYQNYLSSRELDSGFQMMEDQHGLQTLQTELVWDEPDRKVKAKQPFWIVLDFLCRKKCVHLLNEFICYY